MKSYTDFNKKRIKDIVNLTNNYKNKYSSIPESDFYKYTNGFRKYVRDGGDINKILPQIVALSSEAIYRKLGFYPYDVQKEAAIAMSDDVVCEMKTGEGKTLVQILSAYINSIEATSSLSKDEWKSVHILTSNDYLALRDKEDNEKVFSLLGLTTGYAYPQSEVNKDKSLKEKKKHEYSCDIVYGTAKTVAFDYIDDHNVYKKDDIMITKKMYKAVVDEADDVLFDQATKPLILTKTVDNKDARELYNWAYKFIMGEAGLNKNPIKVRRFPQYDYDKYTNWNIQENGKWTLYDCALYEKEGQIDFSDRFSSLISSSFDSDSYIKSKYKIEDIEYAIYQCLLARELYQKGKQYELKEDLASTKKSKDSCYYKIVITDMNTGRSAEKTRYKGGLQEAVEAKENYIIEKENKYIKGKKQRFLFSNSSITLGKTTYPDFMKQYEKSFVGMTGTSDEKEFKDIYGINTYFVDPRIPSKRIDLQDSLYFTEEAKFKAIAKEIIESSKTGEPILVGTTSTLESNKLCKILDECGIKYQRLDSVNNENEEEVVKKAGQKGQITIATNMAGRGTDIKVSKEVEELGGLYVIGASRNKSSRIDNQLRGRSARQGQKGKTKYFISLEDEIVRTKANPIRINELKNELVTLFKNKSFELGKKKEKELKKIVDNCQAIEEDNSKQHRKQEEAKEKRVFSAHKDIIYSMREKILNSSDIEFDSIIQKLSSNYIDELIKNNDIEDLKCKMSHILMPNPDSKIIEGNSKLTKENIMNDINNKLSYIKTHHKDYYSTTKRNVLNVIDDYWRSHIDNLEYVWKLCSYYSLSSKNPIDEYEIQASFEFKNLMSYIENEILTYSVYPSLTYGKYIVKEKEKIKEKEEMEKKTI